MLRILNLLDVVCKFLIQLQNRRMEEVTKQINGYMLGTNEINSITLLESSAALPFRFVLSVHSLLLLICMLYSTLLLIITKQQGEEKKKIV